MVEQPHHNSHDKNLVRKENICFKLIIEFQVLNKLPNWNRQGACWNGLGGLDVAVTLTAAAVAAVEL